MEIQELDNQIVYIKTRLVELGADLVAKMQVGSKLTESLSLKLSLLNDLKKTLRDYRFGYIYLADSQVRKAIQMSNELASNY